MAYAAIATDLYLPAIPAMIHDLGSTEADGQLTLSIFMVGLALGQLHLADEACQRRAQLVRSLINLAGYPSCAPVPFYF